MGVEGGGVRVDYLMYICNTSVLKYKEHCQYETFYEYTLSPSRNGRSICGYVSSLEFFLIY